MKQETIQADCVGKSTDGSYLAKCLKYQLQFFNKYQTYIVPLDRVVYKTTYAKHKLVFDKLHKVLSKFNLDEYSYIEFYVRSKGNREKDVPVTLVSSLMLNQFLEFCKIKQQRKDVYECYMHSVKNIVKDCIDLNYYNVVDYIKHLITERKLAAYLFSGKISEYYFASIPGFKNVIEKLDDMSKSEFKQVYDRYEKYNSDVIDAFLQVRNIKVNTLKFTNEMIMKNRLRHS